jgi:DNA-directed RNA polymerase subunit RPC12/RpoP
VLDQRESQELDAGYTPAAGSYLCLDCSTPLALGPDETLHCTVCGGSRFRRASLFEQPTHDDESAIESEPLEDGWIEDVSSSAGKGLFLAAAIGGRPRVFPLDVGWSRIGRSGAADIRIDDPTVSRRHAVVVLTDEGDLRVLDDRSLNGISVNGERVDSSPLSDGDELQVGRFRMVVLDTASVLA